MNDDRLTPAQFIAALLVGAVMWALMVLAFLVMA